MKLTKDELMKFLRSTAFSIDTKANNAIRECEVTTATQVKLLKLCIQSELMESLITKVDNRFKEDDNV